MAFISAPFASDSLLQLLPAISVQAVPALHCPNRQRLVGLFANSQHKLAAIILSCSRGRKRVAIPLHNFNPLLYFSAQVGIYVLFIIAVNTPEEQTRASAHVALVLVAPFHNL